MAGQVHGYLTIKHYAGSSAKGQALWLARCICGDEVVVSGASVRKGHTRSCGCAHKESISTHGMTGTRTHGAWLSMRERCKRHPHYAGVNVHPDWQVDFSAFFRDMGECPDGLTLDRIDPKGDYTPCNCRWASMKEQVRNRTCNKLNRVSADAIRRDSRPTIKIAEDYRVSTVTVRSIKRGVLWV